MNIYAMNIYEQNIVYLQKFYRRCVSANLRPASIAQYRKVLTRFCRRYAVTNCTADDIREYLSSLKVSPATRKIHYMSLAVFIRYLHREGEIANCPIDRVERPRVPRKVQRFFSSTEVQSMLNCWDVSTYVGIRNRTIMYIFFGTGIRRAEMAGLTVQDILWEQDALFIRGKGGRERTVPLTAELRRILSTYLQAREKALQRPTRALWLSTGTGEALTPAGIWGIFKRVGGNASCHAWRRTFARCWCINGGNLFTLQEMLGHSDIAMTRRYVALLQDDVKAANDEFNPLSNQKWKYV